MIFFVKSNAQKFDYVTFELNIEKDSLGIFDPLTFYIRLINNSTNNNIEVYPIINKGNITLYGEIQIEYKILGDSLWNKYNVFSQHFEVLSDGAPLVLLKPSEGITSGVFNIPIYEIINDSIIASAKKYQIRAKYQPYGPLYIENKNVGEWVMSNPKVLFINRYVGHDLLAFNYLKNLPNPSFIFEPIYKGIVKNRSKGNHNIANAEYIIKNFPESTFVTWAKVYLSMAYSIESIHEYDNPDLNVANLRKSRKYALDLLVIPKESIKQIAKTILSNHSIIIDQLNERYADRISPQTITEFKSDEKK